MESWAQLQPQSNLYNLFFLLSVPQQLLDFPPFHCPRNLGWTPLLRPTSNSLEDVIKTNNTEPKRRHGSQFVFQSGAHNSYQRFTPSPGCFLDNCGSDVKGHKNYEVCFRTYQVWSRLQQPPQDRKGIMFYHYFSGDLCFYLFFEGLLYIAEASQTLIAFFPCGGGCPMLKPQSAICLPKKNIRHR